LACGEVEHSDGIAVLIGDEGFGGARCPWEKKGGEQRQGFQ
jgi:hypothetical protein